MITNACTRVRELSKTLSAKSITLVLACLCLVTAKVEAQEKSDSYLQASHEAISAELLRLADTVDQIFGERRATDQVNRTSVRISAGYGWTGRGDDTSDTEARLNLKLPVFERKGRAVTDKLRFDNDRSGDAPSSPLPLIIDRPVSAPTEEQLLERRLVEKKRWRLRAEPGIRIGSRVAFFETARATRSFFTGNFVHHFSQEITWDSSNLWEENTLVESDYAITERLLFRLLNQGDWQISDSRFTSFHGPSLIQRLSTLSALSYQALVTSKVERGRWFSDSYSVSINYRRAIYSNWAFLEITPGLVFPKEQSFRGMTNLGLRLELLFGAL